MKAVLKTARKWHIQRCSRCGQTAKIVAYPLDDGEHYFAYCWPCRIRWYIGIDLSLPITGDLLWDFAQCLNDG